MPKITYAACANGLAVYLDGSLVGCIEQCEGGYRYRTKDGKHVGETFATMQLVKRDIEG